MSFRRAAGPERQQHVASYPPDSDPCRRVNTPAVERVVASIQSQNMVLLVKVPNICSDPPVKSHLSPEYYIFSGDLFWLLCLDRTREVPDLLSHVRTHRFDLVSHQLHLAERGQRLMPEFLDGTSTLYPRHSGWKQDRLP